MELSPQRLLLVREKRQSEPEVEDIERETLLRMGPGVCNGYPVMKVFIYTVFSSPLLDSFLLQREAEKTQAAMK